MALHSSIMLVITDPKIRQVRDGATSIFKDEHDEEVLRITPGDIVETGNWQEKLGYKSAPLRIEIAPFHKLQTYINGSWGGLEVLEKPNDK